MHSENVTPAEACLSFVGGNETNSELLFIAELEHTGRQLSLFGSNLVFLHLFEFLGVDDGGIGAPGKDRQLVS